MTWFMWLTPPAYLFHVLWHRDAIFKEGYETALFPLLQIYPNISPTAMEYYRNITNNLSERFGRNFCSTFVAYNMDNFGVDLITLHQFSVA